MTGAIVKAREVSRPDRYGLAHLLKRDLYAARLQAKDILAAANHDAAAIRDSANRERQAYLDKGYREGFDAGLAKWNDILAQTWRARDDFFRRNEPDIIRLAVRMAEKILGEQLRLDPTSIASIVREAMKGVRRDRNLVVYVNPAEVEHARKGFSSIEALLGEARDVEVRPNPNVKPGGCIVESELGVIDARLETQLGLLEKALLKGTA